ncbi:MAG: asparagine synthase (glutamine-hydrolyzing) [Alphaproteobacteria bacterium]|nr:MAG: asparagine synthase (glutamine-hydrolyzing) [Alphaproteobacteria bacterium]
MCGIAGIMPLTEGAPVVPGALRRMAGALAHRGPDDEGFLELPDIALASRRLSIVGLPDGRQPMCNEDRSIWVAFNGELFDFRETRQELVVRGHQLRTYCDTEIIAHLYEDHGENFLEHLRGQFALALWDQHRRLLLLARDRIGICPLFWTRQRTSDGEYLLFASEIKALLASHMVRAAPDRRGLNHVFTFLALPGPVTCFKGVEALLPGRYLKVQAGGADRGCSVDGRIHWEMDFPDQGDEERGRSVEQLTDEFQSLMLKAVERRLRADVPVVSYLSGGVDSSLTAALAAHVRGSPVPTFTVAIQERGLNEGAAALALARWLKSPPSVVDCGVEHVVDNYPELIRAAEAPVADTSCAALLMLARRVHAEGYKVALTGEGADEWLAGYSWFKIHRLLSVVKMLPGGPLSEEAHRMFLRIHGLPRFPRQLTRQYREALEGDNAWLELYGMVGTSRLLFFNRDMRELALREVPFDDLKLNRQRMRRWHPFNRSIYIGGRIMLPGHLLASKGDRVAMNSSVETRYPFLDEEVVDFTARLDPRWKMRGLRDKYLLRCLAQRWLPPKVAWRRKFMFVAPFDSFHRQGSRRPAWIDQLLSKEMLERSGYFDAAAVAFWRNASSRYRRGSYARMAIEVGLVGVLATQIWHHTYIDGMLADLPSLARSPVQA